MNAGPCVVVTLLASWASDRYKLRTIAIVCSSALSATGYIIYLCKLCLPVHKKYPSYFTGASHRYTLYGSLFLTASIQFLLFYLLGFQIIPNLIIVVLLPLPSQPCSQILSESQILQITRSRFSSHHELIFTGRYSQYLVVSDISGTQI